MEWIVRFLVGGAVISFFAILGDLLKPKSFAGLFGAAPSVALATLGLTLAKDGAGYAAIECRSMIAGAAAFFIYAVFCSRLMMRYQWHALTATTLSLTVWLGCALGIWALVLK